MAYRTDEDEDRLGKVAREDDAVVAFGRWRDRTRATILAMFCVTGALAGIPGFLGVRELQFRWMDVAVNYVSAIGFVVPLLAGAALGVVVARRVLRHRTSAAIDRIAETHQIDRTVLVEIAAAVDRL